MEVDFWNYIEEAGEVNQVTRAKILSDLMLSTDVDISITDELVNKLSAQIEEY